MCNQFRIPKLALIKQYLTEDLDLPLVEPKINDEEKDVFPNQTAPVLLYQNKQLQLVNKNWGYPSPVDANKPLFNARIERFYEQKPSMWDESFANSAALSWLANSSNTPKTLIKQITVRNTMNAIVLKANNQLR